MSADRSHRLLLRRRLAAQGLGVGGRAGLKTPVAAVERLLAVQAQDFAAARWAIGIRSGATDAEVLAAFARGELVRSWTMRGTLFTVPAVDLPWMLSITGRRTLTQVASRRAQLELDDTALERVRGIVTDALSGGGEISRDEVMALLERNGISTTGQRGYHIIAHLGQTGVWCWGPVRDGVQRLVLIDDWIPRPRELEPDEALGEFVHRYLRGHGPATIRDFASWAKLPLADSRRGLTVARDSLIELAPDLWAAADADLEEPTSAERRSFAASVHALPGFDEYYLGYSDRSAIIEREREDLVVPGGNGVFKPTIISAGRVVGTWRRSTTKAGVKVEAVPFTTLTASERRGFERSARSYARFLGIPLTHGPDTAAVA